MDLLCCFKPQAPEVLSDYEVTLRTRDYREEVQVAESLLAQPTRDSSDVLVRKERFRVVAEEESGRRQLYPHSARGETGRQLPRWLSWIKFFTEYESQ